jgi:hypothetical protein
MITVTFTNSDGSGFADMIQIPEGTTAGQLFAEKCSGRSADSYTIRVNRQNAAYNQILKQGDRVSFTFKKVAGA